MHGGGSLRRSSVLTIAAISALLFAASAVRLNSRFSSAEAAAQSQAAQPAASPKASQLQPASTTLETKSSDSHASAGTEIYVAKRGESIPAVAHQYLSKTSYLTTAELAEAIRSTNKREGNLLKA